jgi:hypothetical protein
MLPAAVEFVTKSRRWNVWASLTFKEAPSLPKCEDAFRRWLRAIAVSVVDDHVPYFYVCDRQQRGDYHFHALLAVPIDVTAPVIRKMRRCWRDASCQAGINKIERVNDPERATRYALAGHNAWEVNVACDRRPRCRRSGSGCVEAPGSWRHGLE